jgi:hypothetical protein
MCKAPYLKKHFPLLAFLCLLNGAAFAEGEHESAESAPQKQQSDDYVSLNNYATFNPFLAGKQSTTPPPEQVSEEYCGFSKRPYRVEAKHVEAKGIGYKKGYTSLTGFFTVPSTLEGSWVPFLDLRGHVFNDGKFAANAGLGVRYLTNWAWGLNAFYDYRNTHRQHYNQISVGLEALGKLLDFRINGYLPVGVKTSKFYNTYFKKFEGNHAILSRKQEFAMKGSNAEIGFHIHDFKDVSLYAATGPYYFERQGVNAWGGEARFDVTFFDYLRLQLSGSYDNVFKGIVQGEVDVIFPFGGKRKIKKRNGYSCHQEMIVKRRALQRVDRQEIIVVDKKRHLETAINPATGSPYVFWFVNNTSHSNGTFESPFNTLTAAQNASSPNDVIYVLPGDLTTRGMDVGIILQDNQKLWGSAVPQTLNTTIGSIEIPPLSPAQLFVDTNPPINLALAPTITNGVGSDVVTLANNNEVSGIYIQNLTGSGIAGSSVSGLSVTNCIIQGPNYNQTNAYGISLANVSGTVLIDSNLIFQGIVGVNITASDIQDATYIISNNDAPTLAINASAPFGNFLMTSYVNCPNLSTIVSGNNFNVSNSPINMTLDNTIPGMQPYSVIIKDNSIKANGAEPVVFGSLVFTLNNSANVNMSIINNNINTPNTDGVLIVQNGNSQLALQIENNIFDTWLSGLSIVLVDSAQLTGSVSNNTFLFDDQAGIVINAANTSTIPSFLITDNQIMGVLDTFFTTNANGIAITTENNATASITCSSNFLQAGASSILLVTNDNSTMTASTVGNKIVASGLFGLNFTTNQSSTGNWTVENNTIVASGTAFGTPLIVAPGAAVITANNGSTTNLSFTNNVASAFFPFPTTTIGTYQFMNAASTFNLTSYSGNTGSLTETGPIGP